MSGDFPPNTNIGGINKNNLYIMRHHILRVSSTEQRKIIKDFIDKNHSYINYSDRPSRKLYWMIFEENNLIGVFGLGSCFHRPKSVSTYMEKHNLQFNEVGNNIVFCLSGFKGKNVGTKVLSLCRKDAIKWWYEKYGDMLKAFQTFILPPRTGAVYRADNWEMLGQTTGGKSLITQTISKSVYEKNPDEYPNIQIKTFKSGKIRYLNRSFKETEPKLIFMLLTKPKSWKFLESKNKKLKTIQKSLNDW